MKTSTKKSITRLLLSVAIIVTIVILAYLIFKHFGITDLTREQLQEYLKSLGVVAPLLFIIISFLQVTFVPIPGAITILAGNYVFGAFGSFIYSYVGMLLGGLFAWWLGRIIGRPYINWVAGSKETADSWIKRLKGRETVFLFFAFLLPLFPDDLLCSVAGILPISFIAFLLMQLVTRATSIGGTLIFMSGEIIPYHGWGIAVLIVLGIITLIAFIMSIKYADKLNSFFDKLINKIMFRKKSKANKYDGANKKND